MLYEVITDLLVAHWHVRRPWLGLSQAETVEAILDRVIDLIMQKGQAMAGLHAALDLVQRQGLKLGLATSSPMRLVEAVLARLVITSYSIHYTKLYDLTRLALPILAAQLAQTSMSLVDTLMAGQVGATDLAAISVATSFWLPIMLFVQGITMALTPVVAQLNGAQKRAQIPASVIQALWLALLTLVPAMLLLYLSPLVLDWMGVEPTLAAKTRGYLHAILWGLPAYGLYQVLRNYTEGLSHTLPSMAISFIGLMINIRNNFV